jgi:hypothetical protein
MAEAEQSQSAEVEAAIEDCVDVLLDFERYPEWSAPITAARVLSRDAEGRGSEVEFELDMKIKTLRYTLRYEYDLPRRATWTSSGGDVKSVEGSYEFEPLGTGGVRATCSQAVDLGFWVPGPVRRIAERQALRDSVNEFKAEAERRSRERTKKS